MHISKAVWGLLLAGSLAVLAACSSQEENSKTEHTKTEQEKTAPEDVEYFSGELTPEEREGDHLTLEVSEKVSVDADILPASRYQEGLKSYYLEKRRDKNVVDAADSKESLHKAGGFDKILKQIKANSSGSFQSGKMKSRIKPMIKDRYILDVEVPYRTEDGKKEKRLSFDRSFLKKKIPSELNLVFSDDLDTEQLGEETAVETVTEREIGKEIACEIFRYDTGELSFGSSKEIGDKLKGQLEKAVGYELADSYLCGIYG